LLWLTDSWLAAGLCPQSVFLRARRPAAAEQQRWYQRRGGEGHRPPERDGEGVGQGLGAGMTGGCRDGRPGDVALEDDREDRDAERAAELLEDPHGAAGARDRVRG
jgi:hypothetical protein